MIENLVVIAQYFARIKQTKTRKSPSYRNKLMLTNFTDRLMRIMLAIVVLMSLVFWRQCFYKNKWPISPTCNLVGILSIISSQTPTNTVFLPRAFPFTPHKRTAHSRTAAPEWHDLTVRHPQHSNSRRTLADYKGAEQRTPGNPAQNWL